MIDFINRNPVTTMYIVIGVIAGHQGIIQIQNLMAYVH